MLFALELGPRYLQRPVDDVAQLRGLRAQLDLALGDPGNVEQVLDDARQALDLALDDHSGGRHGGDIALGGLHELRGVANGGQRVAQLVRQDCDELIDGRGPLAPGLQADQ